MKQERSGLDTFLVLVILKESVLTLLPPLTHKMPKPPSPYYYQQKHLFRPELTLSSFISRVHLKESPNLPFQ